MFPQRSLLRAAPRLLRAPAQRRLKSSSSAGPPGENAFMKERRLVQEHAAGTTDLWRKISLYVCIPALIAGSVNSYWLWNEHWEHWSHLPPLEERTEYPYQNIRVKNFPWGDGDKTLFWNEKTNYHNKDKTT